MYGQIPASVQINGTLVETIAIQSGIRQGCPLSMCLNAMWLHPLVRPLEESLPGMKIGRRHQKTTVLAYPDGVSVFVTDPTTFTTIRHAINTYEQANRARLNPQKSNALATAGWAHPTTPLDIPITDRVKILGVTYGPPLRFPGLTAGRDSSERYVLWHANHSHEHYAWNNEYNTLRCVY